MEKIVWKKFCEPLREHAYNIIDFEIKKNVTVNRKGLKLDQDAAECYVCGNKIKKRLQKRKITEELETIAIYILVNIEMQHIVFVI